LYSACANCSGRIRRWQTKFGEHEVRFDAARLCAKYGQLEMVKFLLRRGAPKSLLDDPPWDAARLGDQAQARRNRESANWITNAGRGQMEVPALNSQPLRFTAIESRL
jgi:hypothetical protein